MQTEGRTSQLARSLDDRRIAGVCGGLGPYLRVDPVWVRIGFVIASLFWGFGLIVYAVLWIMLPEAGEGESGEILEPPLAHRDTTGMLGVILLCLGLLLFLWLLLDWLSFRIVFPAILVALGVFLLRRKSG